MYCELHENRPVPIEIHSERGQFAELPLETIGKRANLGDSYAIRNIPNPFSVHSLFETLWVGLASTNASVWRFTLLVARGL